jgi:hypothetical protein
MNYNHNEKRKYSVYTAAAVIDISIIIFNIIHANIDLNLQSTYPVCFIVLNSIRVVFN